MPLPKGALQWIKETMSPEFFERAKEAIGLAKATGNEHAVTLGYRNWVSPIAEGGTHGVTPIYPQHKKYGFPLTGDVVARMHTHPLDDWSGITVAPSLEDLSMWPKNTREQAIRDLIVSPHRDTFVDYSRKDRFDPEIPDKLYFELMKHTGGNLGGIEPVKPDVYLSSLRNQSLNPKSGVTLTQELGDETDYANELFKTLKRLGMKQGGLVQWSQHE